jgi:hypothetical protein
MAVVSGARNPEKVRGTQSFVSVMSAVWRRTSLMGMEVLWRWCAGGPLLALAAWQALRLSHGIPLNGAALQAMTVFQPVAAFKTIDRTLAVLVPIAKPVAGWLIPLAFVFWWVMAGLGRTVVWRRLDPRLHARPFAVMALGALRAVFLTGVWCLWGWGVHRAGEISITGPAGRGGEPNLISYCAMLICGTLLLYVLWAIASWVLQLAPLLAAELNLGPVAALQAALRSRAVRGKLIEINLVMNIVKLALLVLAMVFSATPLPFASVESQTFLVWWWSGVILLYLAMSDYFQVVRAASYLALWRAVQE